MRGARSSGLAITLFISLIDDFRALSAMNDRQESTTSYDEVEYSSYPFQQSHPDRLATIAALFGMQPARLDDCRVLELGCSSGGNLIPMADLLPNARFLGIDASSKAIERGQETIGALALQNLKLRNADILELDESLGEFDYIITHGVFSWVPRTVQDKILDICSRHLSTQGVAYISYNTYPGWHFRGMIRDVMAYHARFFGSPEEQLHEARELVDFLAKSVPTENNPYGMLLTRELELLRDKASYYLFHEFLEEVNEPLYFNQFAERATAHGLQYLGEAEFSSMSASNFPPQVERMLRNVSNDTIRMEQYMDFVRNRMFRQTLLCHANVQLDRSFGRKSIQEMFIASDTRPDSERAPDIRSRVPMTFRRRGSTLTSSEPLVKAAMIHLGEQWPRAIYFGDLLNAARRSLSPGPLVLEAERVKREVDILAGPLTKCFATTHVDIFTSPPRFTLEVSDCPFALRLARHQARASRRVTNVWHCSVQLTDLQRNLLCHLDGSHSSEDLIDVLLGEVRSGSLVVHEQGTAVADQQRSREILIDILHSNLQQLGAKGLLQN